MSLSSESACARMSALSLPVPVPVADVSEPVRLTSVTRSSDVYAITHLAVNVLPRFAIDDALGWHVCDAEPLG